MEEMGLKNKKRESTFYRLPHNIKGEKRIWEWMAGGDKKGARKREIVLRTPFFPHIFFDLIWIYMSFSFQVSFSLPYHGAIFASPAAVTTRPNTSLTKEKKSVHDTPDFPANKNRKKGGKYQISRISPPLSPENAVTGDTPPAPPRCGGGRNRWVSYTNVFFAGNKITVFEFSNLSRRTHSITHTTFAVDIPLGFYSEF